MARGNKTHRKTDEVLSVLSAVFSKIEFTKYPETGHGMLGAHQKLIKMLPGVFHDLAAASSAELNGGDAIYRIKSMANDRDVTESFDGDGGTERAYRYFVEALYAQMNPKKLTDVLEERYPLILENLSKLIPDEPAAPEGETANTVKDKHTEITKANRKALGLAGMKLFSDAAERLMADKPEDQRFLMEQLNKKFVTESRYCEFSSCYRNLYACEIAYEDAAGKYPAVPATVKNMFPCFKRMLPCVGAGDPGAAGLADAYAKYIEGAADRGLAAFNKHKCRKPAIEILYSDYFNIDQFCKNGLFFLFQTQGLASEIREELAAKIPEDPKDQFPEARQMERRFIIHVGGTNTGKTYEGLQRLKAAPTGAYLSPLRLLALEVQETMKGSGIACGLLTGEEEDLHSDDTHISSTVEKLDIHKYYDVVVIDECQMIADPERGFAWTRAILGVLAPEIHCCVAPEGLEILKKIIEHCGEKYTVVEHQRKVPLTYQDEIVTLRKAQPGDAFVAFSRKQVLRIAAALTDMGKPVSIIYGALPYRTRRLQMQRFLDGEANILVATDAIGMGLNLPIQRIVFTDDSKYDGAAVRHLYPGEVKQIAGRAGRFGIYENGYVVRVSSEVSIKRELAAAPDTIRFAKLGFTETVVELEYDIVQILTAWASMKDFGIFQKMDVTRYVEIIKAIRAENIQMDKSELLSAANVPFDETNEHLMEMFLEYAHAYSVHEELARPVLIGKSLDTLEEYYKELDLYYSFSRAFHLPIDNEWLTEEKERTSELINADLVENMRSKTKRCRICHKPLPIFSKYNICEECFYSSRRWRGRGA